MRREDKILEKVGNCASPGLCVSMDLDLADDVDGKYEMKKEGWKEGTSVGESRSV